MVKTFHWQGICQDEEWIVSGSARSNPARRLDGLVAFGEQRCADYEFAWQLSTGSSWSAERLDLRLVGAAGVRAPTAVSGRVSPPRLNRTLLLERTADGWRSRAWSADRADLPMPGLAVGEIAADAVDVVIDACPLSHWAPVRRLGLAGPPPSSRRGAQSRPLAVAFPVLRVKLPSLAVVLTRQRYVCVEESARSRVLQHSFAGAAPITLTVDDSGMPVEFGGLGRRHDTAMVA